MDLNKPEEEKRNIRVREAPEYEKVLKSVGRKDYRGASRRLVP